MLVVLCYCKVEGVKILGVVNVQFLMIVWEVDQVIYIQVGFEIGVVLIKVFIVQLSVFVCFVVDVVWVCGILNDEVLLVIV